jgi:hypothetical protein
MIGGIRLLADPKPLDTQVLFEVYVADVASPSWARLYWAVEVESVERAANVRFIR